MATKLSQDQINTYFHQRLARLERNNGAFVHPHPTDTDAETLAAEALEVARRADEEKARKAAKALSDAAEAIRAKAHKDAGGSDPIKLGGLSAEPIDPTDPTDPANR